MVFACDTFDLGVRLSTAGDAMQPLRGAYWNEFYEDAPMTPSDKDRISDALSVLDRLVVAATLPRAAAALTLALCSQLTKSWAAVPMFTLGATLLVCAVVKRLENRRTR